MEVRIDEYMSPGKKCCRQKNILTNRSSKKDGSNEVIFVDAEKLQEVF